MVSLSFHTIPSVMFSFHLVNIDKRQACSGIPVFNAAACLRMLTVPAICYPDKRWPCSDALINSQFSKAYIWRLPVELLETIFDALQKPKDVAAFASAHPQLLSAGLRRIHRVGKHCFAPWVGQRMIYACAYKRLPRVSTLSTPAPRYILRDKSLRAEVGSGRDALDRLLATCTLADEDAAKAYASVPTSFAELRQRGAAFDALRWGGVGFWEYPETHCWVMCNATRGIYVRIDEIPVVRPMLGEVICVDSPSAAEVFRRLSTLVRVDPVFEGPWAGDRIAIVAHDMLEDDGSDTGTWVMTTWKQLRDECLRLCQTADTTWIPSFQGW